MAVRRTRAELASLREARIPDNPLHVITPAAVRAQMEDEDTSAFNLSDDRLPIGSIQGLTGLLSNKADLDPTTRVVLPAQLPPATFRALLDSPLANPALFALLRPLLLQGDRYRVQTYAQANGLRQDGALTPGVLYRITNRPTDTANDVLVSATSPTAFAEEDAYTTTAGLDDAPLLPVTYHAATDVATTRALPSPPVAAPAFAAVTPTQLRALLLDDAIKAPFLYLVLRGANGAVVVEGRPGVVDQSAQSLLAAEADWLNPATGAWERKHYDATTDTVTAVVDTSPWRYIGDPANDNIVRGALGPGNTFGVSHSRNTYGSNHATNAYGNEHTDNAYGGDHTDNTYGLAHQSNAYGGGHINNTYGDYHAGNSYGYDSSYNTYGNDHRGNTYGGRHIGNTYGDNLTDCHIGYGCTYLQVGDNCARVLVDNCQGSVGAPFVIPPGTTDAVYRNNVLVTASGITPADVLGLIDLAASSLNGVDVAISSTTGKLVFTAHL